MLTPDSQRHHSRMPDAARVAATLALALVTFAAGCSSKSDSGPGTTSATKTCADLAKCCDRLSEPQKTSCTALSGPKVESACTAGYDSICGSGDGGAGEGGAADGSAEAGSADCADLSEQCAQCANASGKSSCEAYVSAGDGPNCKALLDAGTYAASSTSCQP
jgi:hypothetical protein